MHIRMNIHPLNSTTALSRTKHGAVHHLRSDVLQISIWAYICRVIASQFQVQRHDSPRGSLSKAESSSCGTGESDELDFRDLRNLIQDVLRPSVDNL